MPASRLWNRGDTLVVWRLDRLGRSMPHLVSLVEELLGKGIGFRSLQDGAIDTTTASGELMFNIFSSLAQFERRLIQERTRAGLAAARARGRKPGRRPIRPDDPRVVTAKRLHQDRNLSINQICKTLGISRPTFYRYLALPDAAARAFSDLIELTLSPCHSGESRSPVAFRGFWIPGQARDDGL